MARTPTPGRVGDHSPEIATGDLLDAIEGIDVEIASVLFDNRTGKKGAYTLAVISLTDGRVFHTGGAVVVERLAAIPMEAFPILGTFTQVKSASNPGQSYWTVS
jgi:hypothetical protein